MINRIWKILLSRLLAISLVMLPSMNDRAFATTRRFDALLGNKNMRNYLLFVDLRTWCFLGLVDRHFRASPTQRAGEIFFQPRLYRATVKS